MLQTEESFFQEILLNLDKSLQHLSHDLLLPLPYPLPFPYHTPLPTIPTTPPLHSENVDSPPSQLICFLAKVSRKFDAGVGRIIFLTSHAEQLVVHMPKKLPLLLTSNLLQKLIQNDYRPQRKSYNYKALRRKQEKITVTLA